MSTAPAPAFTRVGTRRALVAIEVFLALVDREPRVLPPHEVQLR